MQEPHEQTPALQLSRARCREWRSSLECKANYGNAEHGAGGVGTCNHGYRLISTTNFINSNEFWSKAQTRGCNFKLSRALVLPKFSDVDKNKFETAATLHFTVLIRVMTTWLSHPQKGDLGCHLTATLAELPFHDQSPSQQAKNTQYGHSMFIWICCLCNTLLKASTNITSSFKLPHYTWPGDSTHKNL